MRNTPAPVYAALALTAALTLWFGQASFNSWWQQTWQQPSPLEKLNPWPAWQSGQALRQWAQSSYDGLPAALGLVEEKAAETAAGAEAEIAPAENIAAPEPRLQPEPAPAPATPEPPPAEPAAPAPPPQNVTLRPDEQVIFVGDSLMQSVAPLMQKALLKEQGIRSVNLSRHSTGLVNTAYFN